jgi:hypothetical protein
MLPLLPLPIPWAALCWVTVSLCGLIALSPLLGQQVPRLMWLVLVLFYPSLYALKIAQWTPIQLTLVALSLWLYWRAAPFWAGLILPLAFVKPTTGLGLLLLMIVFCATDRAWWRGMIVGGLFWYGIPFLLQPDWPLQWVYTIRQYATPADRQFLVTLTSFPDGLLCFAAAAAVGLWCIWHRRRAGLACALLVLAMLVTPHRAQYDYPLFCLPLLFLPRRHLWVAMVAVGASWVLPLTFQLGWNSSLQLTLFMVAPSILACALAIEPATPFHPTRLAGKEER